MAKISVDGIEYEVNPANNLLQECLSQGLDLPYFCWHPCMGSVGACRQCAVKQYRNAEDKTGTVVMACMTPASDGSIISINDQQATDFRSHVIESLMISHPHDCPVCEEGGECHLQDMTQMSGHNYRRYDFKKVTHRNQNLGPFINHEMNRCIACYRCVRFYDDYAGGTDLATLGSHHHVYFGRHEEGTLENEFSGNLVEVCPTGVFTDKTFSAHYTRKWDLQTAPSICAGCGAGCNTTPGERYGTLRRIVNRYHHDLNGYFLCDRGRFGYEANNSSERVVTSLFRHTHDASGLRKSLTVVEAARQLSAMTNGEVIGIGSPRASLESNIALRQRVGPQNFYSGMSDAQSACMAQVLALLREPGLNCPDIRSLELSDCVVVVNEDITNTSARMALALRQATRNAATALAHSARIPLWQDAAVRELAQHSRSPLIIMSPQGTRLDDVASDTFLGSTAQQIALVEAITHALDSDYPAPATTSEISTKAANIAKTLCAAIRPSIVSGISAESVELIKATGNLARALHQYRQGQDQADSNVDLCFAMPEANTLGLALLVEEGGGLLSTALSILVSGKADAAIILENDLYRRAQTETVDAALAANTAVVVIDHLNNACNARAHLLLPAASMAEQGGTWVNYEGRAQHSYQVFQPEKAILAAYQWLALGDPAQGQGIHSDTLLQELAQEAASFAPLLSLLNSRTGIAALMKSPRQSHRYSGRTAMHANADVHESKQAQDPHSPLSFSMEGVMLQKDASLMSAAWAPGWNSNQAISKFQEEINGELKQGNKGVHLLTRRVERSAYCKIDNGAEQGSSKYFIDHLFGGEEISAVSPAIRARAVPAYACISKDMAESLNVQQHGLLRINAGSYSVELPVLVRDRIAGQCVGIYCANELSRANFSGTLHLEAVAQDSNVLASSRAMFSHLVINDALPRGN